MRKFLLVAVIIAVAAPAAAFAQTGITTGGGVTLLGGSRFVAIPDVTVGVSTTKVRDANTSRLGLVCVNIDPTNSIRMGDITVGATNGVRLAPGGSIVITATSTIYGFSEAGSVQLACSEELR